ncbi:molybdopterin-containing oxidoreductase family protein [Geothermobacter hydrogeniphilus]|uniref:Formate dehydrogenase n=1 Tax=Geothermobacter hydrogeniphilus TaxID=1969733 RepID=A0A1X0Y039_9BACT|nr:molybdopterin oxidoreductase family protein [Geothermobacter hydrogeniphilus]ORJ58581.1 formate dehydrogenase [Geothermobacter hydrogeniphilus]
MAGTIHRSVCPYDCPDACGLLVEVEDGRVVSVKGDPEHPFTRGILCAKMQHYERTVHSPRRLSQPLERCGPKGKGSFKPISWAAAIERIATEWQRIIADSGPEAILPYSYAGTMGVLQRNALIPFFNRMGASRLERGICTPAKDEGWRAVMGETPAPAPERVLDSDLVMLWSSNAAATNLHFLQLVKQAKKRGARVWMIDLYRNAGSGVADEVFCVRPGSDGALALGLMHLLVRNGRCDDAFLAEKVQGFIELKEQVLPDYPPERVSALTGLTVEQLEQMAHAFAVAKAPFISLGGGLAHYSNSAMTVRSIVALPTLTGAWERGGGCFVGTSTGAALPMAKITRPDLLCGSPRSINMSQLGDALMRLDDPPVRSLYISHSNPAVVAPDQNRVLQGLAREDLFTVVHERFMTDSARYADILLPATSSLEYGDLFRSYGSYCVQRTCSVIPPVGKSKSNREVIRLLAAAMDYREDIFFRDDEEMIAELLAEPNDWWAGVDRQAFQEGRPVVLTPPRAGRFHTPSGKIEILNPRLRDPLPCYLEPYRDELPLQLVTAPALKTLNSTFFERDELREPQMSIRVHPAEAERRGLEDGGSVHVFNALGEVEFVLRIDEKVPSGLAVAEGVWWREFAPGGRTVNALTSQRLTDLGGGSTFYDNRVDIRRC